MKRMGIEALYRKPNTSKPAPGHKIYPYLLRKLPIIRPNQVWAMDITYIPMARGFIYLAAVLDWFTRRVLAWRVSITLEADCCIEAVEEALATHGTPEMFNTNQGSQFTSTDFIKVLAAREIKISMPLSDCKQSPAGNRWKWRVAGQCLRRALVAEHQIRGSLPTGLCQRVRSPGRDRSVSDLLQWSPPAFIA
jgi:transposase InsO family protein